MFEEYELTDNIKFWLTIIGWTGGSIVLTYVLYKWFAGMVGAAVAKSLMKAGIVIVAA